MAKVQIGAVIGVEGAKQYKAQLDACTAATKNLASQTKLIEASFEGATRSVQDLAKQKIALKGEIAGVGEKLAAQRAELSKVVEAYKRGDENALKYKNQMYDLATETNKTETELYKLEARMKKLNEESPLTLALDAWKNTTSKMGEALKEVGSSLTKLFTVPFVAVVGASVKAAKDWETAFTGVKKTNDEIIDSNKNVIYSYGMLEEELQGIGLRTGSSLSDIAKVAEISGQLGVATDQVADFTEAVVMLADSTNLTSESGASYVATILNLMNRGQPIVAEQAYQLGNAIVYLGNNFNTTEDDIAHMATRLAPAAAQLKMTEGDVLGLATALSESKITAEGGGTAMTQVLTNINKQIVGFRTGTETTLPRIAEIAGMTADVFADTWETRPIDAIDAFITGLSKLDEEGEYTSMIYDELGMSGIRQSLSLNALALTHEHLSSAVKDANKQFESGSALSDEAEKKYATLDSKIQQLKNAFQILGDSIGKDFLEPIKAFIGGIADMVIALSKAPDWVKNLVLGVGAFLAVIGPVLLIVGNIMIWISKVGAALAAFGTSWSAVGAAIGGALAPILGIVAGFTALYLVVKNWDSILPFLQNLWEGIKQTFVSGITAIWEGITTIGSNIWGVISALLDDILSGALHLFEWLAGQLILFVVDTLPNFVSKVVNWVKTMGTNVWNGIKSMSSNALNTVRNLGSSIGDTFRSLASSAWNWGKDIISNLASGIRSRISSLIDSVKNVASTIWSYLHFSEPEKGALKDFNTWMPDMMQGMAQGIYDNMYLVDRAAATVADSLGMGGNTSYNYGGVVINLNVPQGANGYQLVDQIEDALAQRTVRRRAVFG